jgi:uncharacterized protein YbbC (DUF1343 family)
MPVVLGFERLLAEGRLRGKRVGLVANPASVDASLIHVADRIRTAPGVTLAAIFGPQHGFNADLQDNMIETGHARDDCRRVPVYSLYSETREPAAEMLKGLDVLVIDLQDVGSRIYTFIYTMANCMRAAGRHGLPVIVCDRPNPIGGDAVEGPMLIEGFESFVGLFPIPMRHGMTIAELARLFNDAFGIGCDLTISPMDGWARSMYFDATRLPWVMPSPNMPTLDSAIVYPGTVMVEGTNLSEGRGTTRPFELVGAPWIRSGELAARLNSRDLPGVRFRAVDFQPTFQKHAGVACGGCQIHVIDRRAFRPVATGVALMIAIRSSNPERFGWRQPPYEYEHTKLPIDILAGSGELREQIERDEPLPLIAAEWDRHVARFNELRQNYLLY